MGLNDFDAAIRLKEAVYKIAARAIEDLMPRPKFATVTAVNLSTNRATCQYPDEGGTFDVPMTNLIPAVGAVVRIAGTQGARYIDEIMTKLVVARGLIVSGSQFDSATSGTTKLNAGATASTPLSASRKYMARLELCYGWFGTVAGDTFSVGMELDGSQIAVLPMQIVGSGWYQPFGSMAFPFTTTTGNHVVQASAQRSVGTGSLQFRGRVHVYDDGPV
jgi:hypothetical protein